MAVYPLVLPFDGPQMCSTSLEDGLASLGHAPFSRPLRHPPRAVSQPAPPHSGDISSKYLSDLLYF